MIRDDKKRARMTISAFEVILFSNLSTARFLQCIGIKRKTNRLVFMLYSNAEFFKKSI